MLEEVVPYIIAASVAMFLILIIFITEGRRILKKLKDERNKYEKKWRKEMYFRKSSEVRLGKIGENLTPFLRDWPWDPSRFHFLGHPVDGIQFNDDEIIFIEVKTGKARLSVSQKGLKDLVKKGKVAFATFRISEDGASLLKE